MKDVSKTWALTGKRFEDFTRKKKNRNFILDLSKNPSGTQGPRKHQLNMALVNSMN